MKSPASIPVFWPAYDALFARAHAWCVIKVEIEEPDGLPVQAGATYFRTATPRCFEWQFVHVDNEVVAYHESQTIDGLVEPIPPASYNWSTSAGTLNEPNTETPTFVPNNMAVPATMTSVDLELRPIVGTDICMETRQLEVYRDHLERDFENFGTGKSCGDIVFSTSWKFTRYGLTTTMPKTWNCFGSVWHAYDGTHDGQATDVPASGFSASTYTDPIDWNSALSGISRGDVVAFFHDDTLEHAHTCMGSAAQMYGANNEPGIKFVMRPGSPKVHMTGRWRWGMTSSQQYYDKFNSDYARFRPSQPNSYLNTIKVYHKQ